MALRHRALGAVFTAAIMVGCSGDPAVSPSPSPPPTAPPATASASPPPPTATAIAAARLYTFDDGALTIEVPPGALPDGTELTATQLGPEDRPPELADVEMRGTFYRLEPDGLTFAQPVLITRRVAVADMGYDLATDGLPIITLALRTSDGQWEWLAEQAIFTDGEYIYISGEASHTSQLFGFGGTNFVQYEWSPPDLQVPVGGTLALDGVVTAPLDAPAPPVIRDNYVDPDEPYFDTGLYTAEVIGRLIALIAPSEGYVSNSAAWEDSPPEQRDDLIPSFHQQFECPQSGQFFAVGGPKVDRLGAGNTLYEGLGWTEPSTTVILGQEVTCIERSDAEVTLMPDCYADATAPCSTMTLSYLDQQLGIVFDSLPAGFTTLSAQFVTQPSLPEGQSVDCRAFGDVANCVVRDEFYNTIGQPGPAGTADFGALQGAMPSLRVPFAQLDAWLEDRIGAPLESLTPLEVTYTDAEGNVGGGFFSEAAQEDGRDWSVRVLFSD